jgi:hypothetical protein
LADKYRSMLLRLRLGCAYAKADALLTTMMIAGEGRSRASPIGYGRYARAADAIRFAMEELPPELLPGACLEVDEEIFDRDDMLRLYESGEYPLVRRATTGGRTRSRSQP